jgi:hypothetical protein
MKTIRILSVVLLLWSLGAIGSDYQSPRAAALGGASRANPILNDSIYLNPSFASFLPTYSLALGWSTYRGTPEYGARAYNVSILDGRSPLFQAGVGYTVKDGGSHIHVAASKALLERLSIGVGSQFFMSRDRGVRSAQDVSVGMTYIPVESFQFAVVGEHLLETEEGKSQNWSRRVVVGTQVNVMNIFSLMADAQYAPNTSSGERAGYAVGAEFKVMTDFYLRGGTFQNIMVPFARTQGKGGSFGLGWIAPRISLDYAFTRMLSSPVARVPTASAHQLSATMYF